MNTELRKEATNDFEKDSFKLMNNAVFGKTMENARKYRDIKLVATDKRRNQLVSEPNYYAPEYFSENLMAIEIKKAKVKMNKSIYLGMSILDISKTLMYEFWYDYIKPSIKTEQNYATWVLTALLFILKLKIFIKRLLMMLKSGLRHQTPAKMIIDRFQQIRTRKKLVFSKMNQEERL